MTSMIPNPSPSVAEVLEAAADLIEPEGRWTREYYALNKAGKYVDPSDPSACQFCMIGAIAHAAGQRVSEIEGGGKLNDALIKALGRSHRGFPHSWNDKHSQSEVVSKLREAAAKAREQGQ